MARIVFTGLCGGTVEKVSSKTGKPYKITDFTDLSGSKMKVFQVFGDLGLPKDLTPKEYVLDASVVSLGDVQVVSGVSGKTAKS